MNLETLLRRDLRLRRGIVLVCTCVLLGYTFIYGLQMGMHETIPEPVGRHTVSLAIALSGSAYGLAGYQTYGAVLHALYEGGLTKNPIYLDPMGLRFEDAIEDAALLNGAISRALNIDVDPGRRLILEREDLGLVSFYKAAMSLFGYRIQGFYYFYFVLLVLSVILFAATFRNRVDLLFFLLLLVGSHFVALFGASTVGIELKSVHNARFMPVLAFFPMCHLAILVLTRHHLTPLTGLSAAIQSSILILVVHVRSSSVYLVVFLVLLSLCVPLWLRYRQPRLRGLSLRTATLWPLVLVGVAYLGLKVHLFVSLDTKYGQAVTQHLFWNPAYRGLSAHPELARRYDIQTSDSGVFERARSLAISQGLIESGNLTYTSHEIVMRGEFLRIVASEPLMALQSYIMKPQLFLKNYWGAFGVSRSSHNPLFLVIVLVGVVASYPCLHGFGRQLLGFSGATFAMSALPTLLYLPSPWLITDPAFAFTTFVLLLVSVVLMLARDAISRLSFKRGHV